MGYNSLQKCLDDEMVDTQDSKSHSKEREGSGPMNKSIKIR